MLDGEHAGGNVERHNDFGALQASWNELVLAMILHAANGTPKITPARERQENSSDFPKSLLTKRSTADRMRGTWSLFGPVFPERTIRHRNFPAYE